MNQYSGADVTIICGDEIAQKMNAVRINDDAGIVSFGEGAGGVGADVAGGKRAAVRARAEMDADSARAGEMADRQSLDCGGHVHFQSDRSGGKTKQLHQRRACIAKLSGAVDQHCLAGDAHRVLDRRQRRDHIANVWTVALSAMLN